MTWWWWEGINSCNLRQACLTTDRRGYCQSVCQSSTPLGSHQSTLFSVHQSRDLRIDATSATLCSRVRHRMCFTIWWFRYRIWHRHRNVTSYGNLQSENCLSVGLRNLICSQEGNTSVSAMLVNRTLCPMPVSSLPAVEGSPVVTLSTGFSPADSPALSEKLAEQSFSF